MFGEAQFRKKEEANIKACRQKVRKLNSEMHVQTATLSFSSMETLSTKYVEILCWNLCFENKRQEGAGGDYGFLSLAAGS